MDRGIFFRNHGGKQGIPQNTLFQCADYVFFPAERVVEESRTQLYGTDGGVHGNTVHAQMGISLPVYIMQYAGNDAQFVRGKRNHSALPKSRRRAAAVKGQQRGVDFCFQTHMAAMVPVIFFPKPGFPVDIRVTVGVQQVVAKKAGNIGFGNLLFFFAGKQSAAVQQMAEKSAGMFCVGHRANVVFMNEIGRQEVKKQIGTLQSQTVCGMIVLNNLFQRDVIQFLPGVQTEQVMCGKSRHGVVLLWGGFENDRYSLYYIQSGEKITGRLLRIRLWLKCNNYLLKSQ